MSATGARRILDLTLNPYVDLVGDLAAMPIRSDSIDLVITSAVMEHIASPDEAISETHRVLRPGGYVYADWSFLTAYHGYPGHYSNLTTSGIAHAFRRFRVLDVGVAPFQGPAFALRSVIGTYIEQFRPRTRVEREFLQLLHRVMWHPLEDFDERIPRDQWFRLAAGVYLVGVKQPSGSETIIPEPVLAEYSRSADLQRRFPKVMDLSVPENLMIWAKTEGRRQHRALDEFFQQAGRFSKRGPLVAWDRSTVNSWPAELLDKIDDLAGAHDRRYALWFTRPFLARLCDCWDSGGPAGAIRCLWLSLKHRLLLLAIWMGVRRKPGSEQETSRRQ